MGGPFDDRSGGLISFFVANLHDAKEIILQDPFMLEDLVEQYWIKEWALEQL